MDNQFMRNVRKTMLVGALGLTSVVGTNASHGGGPLEVFEPGTPYVWLNQGRDIQFNPDQGALGTLSHADVLAQTSLAFDGWTGVASATISYAKGAELAEDIDETNFGPFFFETGTADGLSPIIYDADGEIFREVFGGSAEFILGFASPEVFDAQTGDILEVFSFLNGLPLISDAFPFSEEEMFGVQIHEFGHFSNLAHTVVNGQIALFDEPAGPEPTAAFPIPDDLIYEIMYPFASLQTALVPQREDIASLSAIYPEDTFGTDTGTIRGTIFDSEGSPITGVNVVARNVADPFKDAISAISSNQTQDYTSGAPFVGEYEIKGLTPGASYVVYVDRVVAGGFSTPLAVFATEEFYNGANESSADTDIPSESVEIITAAGIPVEGIDIHLAPFKEGVPLPIGDESAVELALPFAFEFCGTEYESVFIHDNGFLMFGGSTPVSFFVGAEEFLGSFPRVAPMWTDLNPAAGGTIVFNQTADSYTVSFDKVPEFPDTGENTFSVTLYASGRFDFNYGELKGGTFALGNIGGYSCGGTVTTGTEAPADLTDLPDPVVIDVGGQQVETPTNSRLRAVYELLTVDSIDLADFKIHWGSTLDFSSPGPE